MKIRLIVWLLVASLIAFVILRAGRFELKKDNSIYSYGPSGTSAFVTLLEESGYQVKVQKEASKVKVKADEPVLIISSSESRQEATQFINKIKTDASIVVFYINTIGNKETSTSVQYGYNEKTIGTIKPVSNGFSEILNQGVDDSLETLDEMTTGISGQTQNIFTDQYGRYIADSFVKGDRKVVAFSQGAIITNEFIENESNATVALSALKLLADTKKPLILVAQYASDDDQPGLIEKIGPATLGAWRQLLFLVFVVFLTLCVRFGFPPEPRAQQRGARELVDGVATLLQRKKQHHWALQAVFERVLRELEKRHRVSREEILGQPDKYLTEKEIRRVKDIQLRMTQPMKSEEAVDLANSLRRLV